MEEEAENKGSRRAAGRRRGRGKVMGRRIGMQMEGSHKGKERGGKADTDRGSGERGMREIKSALRFDMAV